MARRRGATSATCCSSTKPDCHWQARFSRMRRQDTLGQAQLGLTVQEAPEEEH